MQRSGGQLTKHGAVHAAEQAAALCATTRQAASTALRPADALRLHGLADSLGWLHATLLADDWQTAPRTLQALSELQSSHAAVGSALSADASAAVRALIATLQAAVVHSTATTRAPVRKRAGKPAAAEPSPGAAAQAQQAAAPAFAPRRATFGATAPRQVVAGQVFVARFLVYDAGDAAQMRKLLDGIESGTDRTRRLGLNSALLDGGFRLHLEPSPGILAWQGTALSRDVDWSGSPHAEDFELVAGADSGGKPALLRFQVEVAGVTVASLSLELQAGALQATVTKPGPVHADATLPQSIFASYSSRDRERVLDRVAAIRFFGIDVFVDCLDLAPSEPWKAALEREIAARQLFLLFWSEAAKKSAWVRWEYQQALAGLQADRIRVQPLENGIDPPRALKHLHFGDPLNDARQAALARSRRLALAATEGVA